MDLNNGKKCLFDYAATLCQDDSEDKRIDLPKALREDLNNAERDFYDVVAFSHLDLDHIKGSTEFFYLEHDKKFQSKDRIKINELWVPAAVIIEDKETLGEEHAILQKEARYRLLNKQRIRVFSRPDALKGWLKSHSLELDAVRHLVTDAGQFVPGFTIANDGVELFVHSPFARRLNECELVDRNSDSLVLQATYNCNDTLTRLMLGADTPYDIWTDIVDITRLHKREERLEWDIFKLPHHCSYLSLGPDKGKEKTEPVPNVKWLFEEQGHEGGIIVSPSHIIPGEDTDQPPHRQAANYHKENCANKRGEFKVTMEHPTKSSPKPLVIIVDNLGAKVEKRNTSSGMSVIGVSTPRAG